MTYERFVSQFDACAYMPGGFNCTCASEAMWLYRASQSRVVTSSCHVRTLTGDQVGGTNLSQMKRVSEDDFQIYNGVLYQPTGFDSIVSLVSSGRYGSHLNISYSAFVGTPYDRFHGQFRGNHDIYLSRHGATAGTLHVGDPGATGFVDIPTSLLRKAAGLLDLGNGQTINSQYGLDKCYAYITPPDPVVPTHQWHINIATGTKTIKTVASFGSNGCIASWTNNAWSGVASSAPCRAPFVRPGCSSGSAQIAYVTAGVFAGKYVRIGSGVTAA